MSLEGPESRQDQIAHHRNMILQSRDRTAAVDGTTARRILNAAQAGKQVSDEVEMSASHPANPPEPKKQHGPIPSWVSVMQISHGEERDHLLPAMQPCIWVSVFNNSRSPARPSLPQPCPVPRSQAQGGGRPVVRR